MPLTKEDLQRLIALQGQDAALDKVKAELDRIPREIDAMRAALDGEKARFGEAKARMITLEKKKKEKELELASKEEAARKHGGELNSVKTNEAFKALQNEIERAKNEGSAIETEILELMEAIDACRRDEKAAAAELKAVEDRSKSEVAVLEGALAQAKSRFDAAKAERDQAAVGIAPEAMRIYDHVRSRGKLDAVVPIEDKNCSACRMLLAPQVIVEATKAKNLVTCESCQRILFRPEPVKAA